MTASTKGWVSGHVGPKGWVVDRVSPARPGDYGSGTPKRRPGSPKPRKDAGRDRTIRIRSEAGRRGPSKLSLYVAAAAAARSRGRRS